MQHFQVYKSWISLLGWVAIALGSPLTVKANPNTSDRPQILPFRIAGSTGVKTPPSQGQGNAGNPLVAPPQSKPYGLTYAEWGVRWWKWIYSFPYNSNPLFDKTGANAALNQSGPVWFLVGTSNEPAEVVREVTIPAGKGIFFPIVAVNNDYPCPDPNFKPSSGQTLEDFLTNGNSDFKGAEYYVENSTLAVEVNGKPLNNLFHYKGLSGLFDFVGHPSLKDTFDGCVTGDLQQGVSNGYWIMLRPLPPGIHTVRIYGLMPNLGTPPVNVFYKITVTP